MNRLGELMLEGIAKTKGIKSQYLKRGPINIYCCPIGAVVYACNPETDTEKWIDEAGRCANVNMYQTVTNPKTQVRESLCMVIIDLWDDQNWSRKKIAQWVGGLELS